MKFSIMKVKLTELSRTQEFTTPPVVRVLGTYADTLSLLVDKDAGADQPMRIHVVDMHSQDISSKWLYVGQWGEDYYVFIDYPRADYQGRS